MSLTESTRLKEPYGSRRDHDLTHLRESYPAVPESVPAARAAIARVAAAAGASPEQVDAIRLAASEALTNAVLYAYSARTGHIHVTARVAGGELWLLITDNGCGIHAGPESDGLGLGLALIAQVSDGFSVMERSCGGTELRLRFVLEPAASAQERGSVASASSPAASRFSTTT